MPEARPTLVPLAKVTAGTEAMLTLGTLFTLTGSGVLFPLGAFTARGVLVTVTAKGFEPEAEVLVRKFKPIGSLPLVLMVQDCTL